MAGWDGTRISRTVPRYRYAVSSLMDTAYRLSEQYLEISSFKLQNACLLAQLHQFFIIPANNNFKQLSTNSCNNLYKVVITEYLVDISKRRAFWSLNEDILKITILTTNTPYPSRKIRRIRASTYQRPQWKEDQYIVSREDQYAVLDIWHVNILEDIKRDPYSKKLQYADNEDVYDLRSVETKFQALVFNDTLTYEETLFCEPTVSSLNDNEIDFKISFDESDDEDYTCLSGDNPECIFNFVIDSVLPGCLYGISKSHGYDVLTFWMLSSLIFSTVYMAYSLNEYSVYDTGPREGKSTNIGEEFSNLEILKCWSLETSRRLFNTNS
ncbi:hypothetical protein Tco_0490650 [Tanacetum coccineum]